MSPHMIECLKKMRHSPAHNYVIPGLTSWLIGAPHPTHGCVRMFTMDRVHEENIIPHSHRFDFRCVVLEGKVVNHLWEETTEVLGDPYQISDVSYEGILGKHRQTPIRNGWFRRVSATYDRGTEYGMLAEQFHSIQFAKGTTVLFFEGPNRLDLSQVLEPISQGEVVPLFRTEPWMFKRSMKNEVS